MIKLQAYSRLHFGFLNPIAGNATQTRCFGGVGVMIAQPSLSLFAEPDAAWSADGPQAERALEFARRFAAASCRDEPVGELTPHHLRIERMIPPHAGLGSGTQLGLSVARALAATWALNCDLATLARRIGRGLRSAVGTHGFAQGGFLVEGGKAAGEKLAPLIVRQPFPEEWRFVVTLAPHPSPPPQGGREKGNTSVLLGEEPFSPSPLVGEGWGGGAAGLHGGDEVEAFARLAFRSTVSSVSETLCRIVLLGLLPALVERDLDSFGEALHEFNRRVGEVFAPVQGGVYASAPIAELVQFIRAQNIRGVAQSSWGAAVFAVVSNTEHAEHLAAQIRRHFHLPPSAVWTTPACNHGARLQVDERPA